MYKHKDLPMSTYFLLITTLFLTLSTAYAQETKPILPLTKGKWLIELNTGFGNIQPGNTGMAIKISNGEALWNIGGEAGYFITNRLALKLGLGFGNYATGPTSTRTEGGEGSGSGEAAEGGNGGGEAAEGSASSVGGTGGASIAGLGAILSYKLGIKYYLQDIIPIQIDFSGTNVNNYNHELGFQAGYAFFLGKVKNISIEPGLRYSIPLSNKTGTIDNQFQMNVGFSYHF